MLHENLRRIMASQDLTTEALLIKLHAAGYPVSFRTVESWLNGARTPMFSHALGLAAVLGCSIEDLTADDAAA